MLSWGDVSEKRQLQTAQLEKNAYDEGGLLGCQLLVSFEAWAKQYEVFFAIEILELRPEDVL